MWVGNVPPCCTGDLEKGGFLKTPRVAYSSSNHLLSSARKKSYCAAHWSNGTGWYYKPDDKRSSLMALSPCSAAKECWWRQRKCAPF